MLMQHSMQALEFLELTMHLNSILHTDPLPCSSEQGIHECLAFA